MMDWVLVFTLIVSVMCIVVALWLLAVAITWSFREIVKEVRDIWKEGDERGYER